MLFIKENARVTFLAENLSIILQQKKDFPNFAFFFSTRESIVN